MTDYALHPDFRLVNLLFGLAARYGKLWCYPCQDKLCDLLTRFHGRAMSRRTLNRHLGGLVRDGWLKRVRRHRRGDTGALELHSTLYVLSRRALRAFASLRAGLRFLGRGPGESAHAVRCARSGTISVPVVQNKCLAAPPSPPRPRQNVAATATVAALRAILAGR